MLRTPNVGVFRNRQLGCVDFCVADLTLPCFAHSSIFARLEFARILANSGRWSRETVWARYVSLIYLDDCLPTMLLGGMSPESGALVASNVPSGEGPLAGSHRVETRVRVWLGPC